MTRVNTIKLALGQSRGSLELEPVGHMDLTLPANNFIPWTHTIPDNQDVSVLRIRRGKVPGNDQAALPGFTNEGSFVARFVGVNKEMSVDPQLMTQYPAHLGRRDLKGAIRALRPGRVSIADGRGVFTDLQHVPNKRKNTLQHVNESTAPFLSYDISTTPGASGSAISQAGTGLIFGKSHFQGMPTNG
jgi:hypothetical protein